MSSPGQRKLNPPSFAALVQSFFAEHLTQQRALSARTVAAYRDAFLLFLNFVQSRLHKAPTAMLLSDLTPTLILAFLDHLENDRHNTVRSRNARLAALRTFLKFAARRDLTALHIVEAALGVPMKRFERPMLGFLSREEVLAVIGKPGVSWVSQRDGLLLALLYNTGDTGVGGHRRDGGRRSDRPRSVRAPAWQGAQATFGAVVALDGQGHSCLATAQPRPGSDSGTASQPQRPSHDAIECHAAVGVGCASGDALGAQLGRPRDLSSHPAPLDGNALAAVGRGHQRDRAVARP